MRKKKPDISSLSKKRNDLKKKKKTLTLDNHLVQRQRSRLVRAQHVHSGHLLDSGQLGHDRALLRQRAGAQRERRRRDDLDRNRDRRDQQHDDEREHLTERLLAGEQVGEDDAAGREGQAREDHDDAEQDLLEVAQRLGLDFFDVKKSFQVFEG